MYSRQFSSLVVSVSLASLVAVTPICGRVKGKSSLANSSVGLHAAIVGLAISSTIGIAWSLQAFAAHSRDNSQESSFRYNNVSFVSLYVSLKSPNLSEFVLQPLGDAYVLPAKGCNLIKRS